MDTWISFTENSSVSNAIKRLCSCRVAAWMQIRSGDRVDVRKMATVLPHVAAFPAATKSNTLFDSDDAETVWCITLCDFPSDLFDERTLHSFPRGRTGADGTIVNAYDEPGGGVRYLSDFTCDQRLPVPGRGMGYRACVVPVCKTIRRRCYFFGRSDSLKINGDSGS